MQNCVRSVLFSVRNLRYVNDALLMTSAYIVCARSKTGRGSASVFKCKDLARLSLAEKKVFTREWGKRFGFDVGIQNTMVLLSIQKTAKNLYLDPKKRLQLGTLFQSAIMEFIEEDENLVNCRITLCGVDVSPSFVNLRVSWLAKGDGTDEETGKALAAAEGSIRLKLFEKFGNNRIPTVKFVMNDKHLFQQKMDKLFEELDYGMQYRAVSKTGAILGSLSDTGSSSNNEKRKEKGAKKLPWLKNLDEQKKSEEC